MRWWLRYALTNPATWCSVLMMVAMCAAIAYRDAVLALVAGAGAVGCPNCRGMNLVGACDECDQAATYGTPTADGYANTCYEHRPVQP